MQRGALVAVGIGWYETGRAASKVLARVLRGEQPRNIPFEEVAVKKLVLNQEVAKSARDYVPARHRAGRFPVIRMVPQITRGKSLVLTPVSGGDSWERHCRHGEHLSVGPALLDRLDDVLDRLARPEVSSG